MGIVEESPSADSFIEEVRLLGAGKRKKRVQLTFCRSLLETPSKALPLSPPPSIPAKENLKVEPRLRLYDQQSSSSSSCSANRIDLRFLLTCDAISRDFLLPHFSFHDLLALERTCKAIRHVVREKRWWRSKVADFRGKNEKANELLSRYSSSLSIHGPEYHKKMISKYLADTSKIIGNIKGSSCRKSCKAFSLEATCHKAFTVHESAKMVFLQEEGECVVMAVETNKSKRGVVLRPFASFPVVQTQQYCSLLTAHRQLLFHVTYQQLHVWNWRRNGERVEVTCPSENELMGLGLARAVMIRGDCLIIGSNDAGFYSTGAALVQFWRIDSSDLEAEGQLGFTLADEIAERPEKSDMPTEFGEVIGMKPSSISLDGDEKLVGVAVGLYCFSQLATSISAGKIVFYDLDGKKAFGSQSFRVAVSCIRVNSDQRKAVVGFEKRSGHDEPYVRIIDVDSGDTLKELRSKLWGPRCLWTDWKRLIFTGDDDGLLVWDVMFGHDDVGKKRQVNVDEAMATFLSGCNGLPTTDRICDVVFDGFHLLVYTRGGVKATIRVLDFLKLSSVKF